MHDKRQPDLESFCLWRAGHSNTRSIKNKTCAQKAKVCNMDIEGGFFMVSTIYLYLPRRMKHINNTVKRIALVDLSCIFKKVNSTQTNAFYQFISKETFY